MKKQRQYIVVDDDRTNNMICEYTIKACEPQAEVHLFTDPEEALSVIENSFGNEVESFPVILFLDVNMPVMSGWEFLDVFKDFKDSLKRQFQVFVLTSSIEDFSKEAQLYPFVAGFLSKPLKKDKLLNLLDDLSTKAEKSPKMD